MLLFLWTISFGQWANLEFRSPDARNHFYNLLFDITPFAVLATLFGTVKKRHSRFRNGVTVFSTVSVFVMVVLFLLSNMFTLGFGSWRTTEVLYRHSKDHRRQVLYQQYDAGALGYGGERVVMSEPRYFLFNKVTPYDTTQWRRDHLQRVDNSVKQLP